MSRDYVSVGAVAPNAVRADVVPSDAIPDLTAVLSVTFEVRRWSTGSIETWPGEILSQSSTTMQVGHEFDGTETAYADRLRITPKFTTAGGVVSGRPFTLRIVP
jgi:hypothetical protein